MLRTCLQIARLIDSSSSRDTEEHQEFLVFLEELIKGVSPVVSREFGKLDVKMKSGKSLLIELTPADFGYWYNTINNGERFKRGVREVKLDIYNRLCSATKSHDLTEEEREAFMELVKSK